MLTGSHKDGLVVLVLVPSSTLERKWKPMKINEQRAKQLHYIAASLSANH